MLGHLGVNVPDLPAARAYYGVVLPELDFEPFLVAGDLGSPIVHWPQEWPQYPPPYFAMFWQDPVGVLLEAVCHHDAD